MWPKLLQENLLVNIFLGKKKPVAPGVCFSQDFPNMEGVLETSLVDTKLENTLVIQGVVCNLWWLERSLVVDIREHLSATAITGLAMAA